MKDVQQGDRKRGTGDAGKDTAQSNGKIPDSGYGNPEGVGRLMILLGMRDQEAEDDVVWFDDVELYRLP